MGSRMTFPNISALAVALSLGFLTPADAQDWAGGTVTFGLSGTETDLGSSSGIPDGPQSETVLYTALAYDWQPNGGWTYGIVGDLSLTSIETDDDITSGKGFYGESGWFTTLRGRVGLPVNDDLRVFASGGIALLRAGASFGGLGNPKETSWEQGVAYSLGADYRVRPRSRITIEYLQADFGQTDTLSEDSFGVVRSGTLDPDVRALRIGYVFEF